MRLVANFWRKISAWWLTIKLLTSLSGFLVWFGWQTYATSSVLLISLIWMCLGGLLLMQQLLFWYQPTITHFNPPAFVLAAPILSKAETKLYTHQSFSNWCHRVLLQFQNYPTHRDLGINASLCATLLSRPAAALEAWQQAKNQDPNSELFTSSPIELKPLSN